MENRKHGFGKHQENRKTDGKQENGQKIWKT
jgi:hypothetical protein